MSISLGTRRPAAFTICAFNYLRKALVLRESFLKHNPDCLFFILLVERKSKKVETVFQGIDLMWAEDLGIDGFLHYAFMYDVIELSTNIKAVALKKLASEFGKVLYIDPDIKVFSSLEEIYRELDESSIVVTPHALTPVLDGKNPNDLDFSRFGSFNLGFIGVSGNEEAKRFLEWWEQRCLRLGFYEPQSGLAVDQKWVDLAPAFFPGLKILRHLGMNVAFWNLHERTLAKIDDRWMVNKVFPLGFFHLSSFDATDPLALAYKQNRFKKGARLDIEPILLEYAKDLARIIVPSLPSTYSYDYFSSGEYITPLLRRVFAIMPEVCKDLDPFAAGSMIHKYGLKHGLVKWRFGPKARETFKDLDSHLLSIHIIDAILALFLRMVGPYRYYTLMKYLVHISSVRNQSKIFWRGKDELERKV